MERQRPSGYAPANAAPLGETQLCGQCVTLIRYWPTESVWRHCVVGMDHPPVVLRHPGQPAVSESEARLMDGNR